MTLAAPFNKYRPLLGAAFQKNYIDIIEEKLESQNSRLPLFIPVALITGIALWEYYGNDFWLPLAAAALGLAIFAFSIGFATRLARLLIGAAIIVPLGFGVISFKSMRMADDRLSAPWIGSFYARIDDVENISARDVQRLTLDTGAHPELPQKIRVNFPADRYAMSWRPGTILKLRARLMPPPGPSLPNGYDFARTAWFSGLGATGSLLGEASLYSAAPTDNYNWAERRESLADRIRQSMDKDAAAVGAALLLGSEGAITEEDSEALRNSGMAHLLSVSGLHITAVVGASFILISRFLSLFPFLALRITIPIYAAAGSAIIAIGYTLLVGAEVPAIRACIAALLILVALAIGREALSMRLLAAGATFILLVWPEAMAGPSFQFSFTAVGAIIALHETPKIQALFARREERAAMRIMRWLGSLLLTGLVIELALMPIALFHFHKSGLYGALANIIAIPLTTFFIMPLQILGLILDSIWVGLGMPFWFLASQGVAMILAMAHWINVQPGAVLMMPAMPHWAFIASIFGLLWLAIWQDKWRLWGLVGIILGAIAILSAPRPDILVTGDGKHLAIVDPEQGLALLRPRTGEYMRKTMLESAGIDDDPVALDAIKGAQCSPDICTFSVIRGKRNWVIMATRSRYQIPALEMAAACKRADIVVSDRYLPKSCKARWFVADRDFLARHGGLAIYLDRAHVDTVTAGNLHKPWINQNMAIEKKSEITKNSFVP